MDKAASLDQWHGSPLTHRSPWSRFAILTARWLAGTPQNESWNSVESWRGIGSLGPPGGMSRVF
jgi:hypothetical protein